MALISRKNLKTDELYYLEAKDTTIKAYAVANVRKTASDLETGDGNIIFGTELGGRLVRIDQLDVAVPLILGDFDTMIDWKHHFKTKDIELELHRLDELAATGEDLNWAIIITDTKPGEL